MSAIQQLLTGHIDIWTAADTEKKSGRGRASGNAGSVYGIRKLRELILELAVRGKLVMQDANDESASELLKRIQIEKAKLVAEGKIKKTKVLPPITDDEHPYKLPQGWQWVRLADITSIRGGSTPSMAKSEYWGGDILWVSPKDMHDGVIVDSELKITEKAFKESNLELVPVGSILIVGRSGILKRKLPAQITAVPCTVNQDIKAVTPIKPLSDRYMQLIFWGNQREILIRDVKQGTTVQSLVYESLFSRPFSLPPAEEQHRIVAKVDELMALCDQLENQHSNAAEAHEKLVGHLLGSLTQSQNATDFSAHWQRIAAHFDTLFTTDASIDSLKQTLLKLAVMGKLVPQDTNDEPASELLKRYKISSTASLLVGWSMVSLGKLGDIYGGATPSKANSEYWVGTIPWVSPKDMKHFYIDNAEDKVSKAAICETALKLIPAGSLLMVVRGMILAHSFPVALTTSEVTINQDMKALLVPEEIKDFLLLYMRAMKNSFVSLVDRSSHGTCKLISEKLWAAMVEIPPKAEQDRIVAKVDELMVLCDLLKSRIIDARQLQQKLADVMVEQALA